jgi:hypothetical protein
VQVQADNISAFSSDDYTEFSAEKELNFQNNEDFECEIFSLCDLKEEKKVIEKNSETISKMSLKSKS